MKAGRRIHNEDLEEAVKRFLIQRTFNDSNFMSHTQQDFRRERRS